MAPTPAIAAPARTGPRGVIRRAGLIVVVAGGVIGGLASAGALHGDTAPAPRGHRPRLSPGAVEVAPSGTEPARCFGASAGLRDPAWSDTPEQAVLDAETHLPGPGARDRPVPPVQPPPRRPHRVRADTWADGAWTFDLRHDPAHGWTVTGETSCPPAA